MLTTSKLFDFEGYKKKHGNIKRVDRILKAEGDTPDAYQVSKQADTCMLFYLMSNDELLEILYDLGYNFSEAMISKNIDFYLERTTHGSTLSEIVFSAILYRFNMEKSWELYYDFIQSDIEDTQHGTTQEGIHVAAMSASISILINQYGGKLFFLLL